MFVNYNISYILFKRNVTHMLPDIDTEKIGRHMQYVTT